MKAISNNQILDEFMGKKAQPKEDLLKVNQKQMYWPISLKTLRKKNGVVELKK